MRYAFASFLLLLTVVVYAQETTFAVKKPVATTRVVLQLPPCQDSATIVSIAIDSLPAAGATIALAWCSNWSYTLGRYNAQDSLLMGGYEYGYGNSKLINRSGINFINRYSGDAIPVMLTLTWIDNTVGRWGASKVCNYKLVKR